MASWGQDGDEFNIAEKDAIHMVIVSITKCSNMIGC